MRDPSFPPETVIIGGWNSHCNNCGRGCSPSDETRGHGVLLGWGDDNGKPGCGIKWKYATSEYGQRESVERQWPQFEYLPHPFETAMREARDASE